MYIIYLLEESNIFLKPFINLALSNKLYVNFSVNNLYFLILLFIVKTLIYSELINKCKMKNVVYNITFLLNF